MTTRELNAPTHSHTYFHLIGFSFWQAWWLLAMNTDVIILQQPPIAPIANPIFAITVFTTVGYLAVALIGMKFGTFSTHRASYIAVGLCAAFGSIGLSLFPMNGTGVVVALFYLSSLTFSLGNALLLIMWGELWSTWASGRVGTCLIASYTFAFVLYVAIAVLPGFVASIISCLLPVASVVALYQARHEERRLASQVEYLADTISAWRVIVAAGAIGLMHGFVQCALKVVSFKEEMLHLSQIVAAVVLVAILVYLCVKQPATASIAFYKPIVPLYIAGLVLMVVLPFGAMFVGNGLTLSAVFCVDMLVMLVSTDYAFRTRKPVAVCFGFTLLAMRTGTTCALALVGVLELSSVFSAELFINILLLFCIAIAFIGSFVFTAADLLKLYRAKPTNNVSADAAVHVETVAQACGLTPRETEVLSLLAAGRSVPYIAGDLCIAESTVKHHTSSIYRKIGVSDRQSLIDVIMQGAVGKGAW